jgi:hypothetical protein
MPINFQHSTTRKPNPPKAKKPMNLFELIPKSSHPKSLSLKSSEHPRVWKCLETPSYPELRKTELGKPRVGNAWKPLSWQNPRVVKK